MKIDFGIRTDNIRIPYGTEEYNLIANYYSENLPIIKLFNDDCLKFSKIINTYLSSIRVKYFLNCDLVDLEYKKEFDAVQFFPPIKGLVSKFTLNIPLDDSLLVEYKKNGFNILLFMNVVKDKLFYLFNFYNQDTQQLVEIFDKIDIENFHVQKKIAPACKNAITKTTAQLFIKTNIGYDTFLIEIKSKKKVETIEVFKFNNGFAINFKRSNYRLLMRPFWASDDLLVLKSLDCGTVYLYKLSTKELTIAFSPFNPNRYDYYKEWYTSCAMQKFIEVKIDENYNEIERVG